MIRKILILSAISLTFASHAFAGDELRNEITEAPPVGTDVDTAEVIVHQKDFATHMGLTPQQAVFRTPRNFRNKALNEIGIDSLDSLEALPEEDSKN